VDEASVTEPLSLSETASFAEAMLESELESSLDAVLIVRTDSAVSRYNKRFADMWSITSGTSRPVDADVILRLVLAHVAQPAVYLADVLRFRADPATPVNLEMDLVDGRVVEAHSHAIRGPQGQYLGRIWVFRDLTDRRVSEAALRASHVLLATTERIAHVGGWDWDLVHGVLAWSDETCRMYGRDPETYVPSAADFLAAIHHGDRERVNQAIAQSTKEGAAPYEGEFRIVRPDGSERVVHVRAEAVVDAAGKPVRLVGTNHDVTDQKAVERGLQFANALSKAQLESSPDGILVVGADRRIVSFNRKFVDLWSLDADAVQSHSDERGVDSILHQLKHPTAFLARLEELYADPLRNSYDEIELEGGRVFERHSSPLPIADDVSGRIFFFRDITARKTVEGQIARLAMQDGLTGLANRSVFVESVQLAIARSRRSGKRFALFYLDLDHFKDVNDTLGHPAGDLLLRHVADRLRASVRDPDLVARFGGDEFAVIAMDVTDPTEAATIADRLGRALGEPFPILGNDLRIGASIGVALYGPDVASAEMLLSQADLALYRAKSDGRGTYRFFAEGMDGEVRARVALVSDLREALDTEQLFLAYQPQVEIATGRIVGLEALARWRHPRRGNVGPNEFIPVAETSGLIVPLGRWVIRTACRQAKLWLDEGIAPAFLAVNVSCAQFRTPLELGTTLAAILAETGLPPERLELELTESVLMDAWLEQRDVLVHLRELGVKIAIDDFGTGFSSLEYLSRFPVDRIKIPQCFMKDLGSGPGNAAVVKATIGLGRELGLRVVAEGVETREQLELLKTWGCREVQGYYFARPQPAAELTELLRRGSIHPSRPPAAFARDAGANRPSQLPSSL
jgi:diguanylate cyclase (GGDEF)-like protein/PAS domain S-box-containing protein